MQFDVFDRVLKFMELMAQSTGATRQEICDLLRLSMRSFYRYLEFFENAGFRIVRQGKRYSFDANSPYFRKLTAYNFFSQEETDALLALLKNDPQGNELYQKLLRQKKWHVKNQYVVDRDYADKFAMLSEAVRDKRMIVMHNYSSVKSSSVTDRIVEPYLIMGSNDSIRCYEISARTNKTFRISRIGAVELMPVNWIHEDKHTPLYTDAFNFSGEELLPVEVYLNFRAVSLLTEEFPGCAPYITRKNAKEWLLRMEVCDYRGIGRFCLGLFRDVVPVGSEAFLNYLEKESEGLYARFAKKD